MSRAAWLLAAVILAGCGRRVPPPPKPGPPPPIGPETGQTAPGFSLIDSKGVPYSEASFVGRKAQLLVIGTTSCPMCQAKIVDIEAVRLKRGDSVEVAAMLLSETAAKADKYAADFHAGFRMVLDPQNLTMSLFKPGHYPYFVLVDKRGVIRYTGNDLPDDALLEQAAR
ncbi:MAG: redoxin family protein [Planctomycetes bacterium]|nr:redoxin family protein [Planctomycetota bacterium]